MRQEHADQACLHLDKEVPQDKLRNNALQLSDECPACHPKAVPDLP